MNFNETLKYSEVKNRDRLKRLEREGLEDDMANLPLKEGTLQFQTDQDLDTMKSLTDRVEALASRDIGQGARERTKADPVYVEVSSDATKNVQGISQSELQAAIDIEQDTLDPQFQINELNVALKELNKVPTSHEKNSGENQEQDLDTFKADLYKRWAEARKRGALCKVTIKNVLGEMSELFIAEAVDSDTLTITDGAGSFFKDVSFKELQEWSTDLSQSNESSQQVEADKGSQEATVENKDSDVPDHTEAIKDDIEKDDSKEGEEAVEKSEGDIEKAEYFRLKQEFKAAEKNYYAAIAEDYKARGVARGLYNKASGFGEEHKATVAEKAQALHDRQAEFRAASKAYRIYGEESGIYDELKQKLQARKQRDATALAKNKVKASVAKEKGVTIEEVTDADIEGLELPVDTSTHEVSLTLSKAKRHLFNSSEKRVELQSLQIPEKLGKLKNSILDKIKKSAKKIPVAKALGRQFTSGVDWSKRKIKENPKIAATVGGTALVLGAFATPAMVAAMGVGFISRLGQQMLYVKRYEEKNEQVANSIAEQIEDGGELDFDQLDKEYMPSVKSVRRARNTANVVSLAAAAAAGGSARAYDVDLGSMVSNLFSGEGALSPDQSFGDVSISENIDISDMPTGAESVTEVTDGTPDYRQDIKLDADGLPIPVENPTPMPGLEDVAVPVDSADVVDGRTYVDSVGEGLPKAFPTPDIPSFEDYIDLGQAPADAEVFISEAESASTIEVVSNGLDSVEATHTVERGENLSTILSEHINELVNKGMKLPPGVDKNGLTHYMYQSFPEMTSASDITPRLSPQDWIDVGVKSGDPHLIRPGEVINMEALAEKMWGASYEEAVDLTSIDTDVSAGAAERADLAEVVVGDAFVSGDEAQTLMGNVDAQVVEEGVSASQTVGAADAATGSAAESLASGVDLDPVEAMGPPTRSYEAADFNNLLENIGPAHDFSEDFRPSMWKHVLIMMDEMSIENKMKYLGGLVVPNGPGEVLELNKYDWLQYNMPEIDERWGNFDTGQPDRLMAEQWKYVGVPSGDPKDLAGAVLDHAKFFEVLFDPQFDLANPAESADSAGLGGDEVVAAGVEPEPVIPNNIEAPYTESDQLRGYREDVQVPVRAESMAEVTAQLVELKEKFASVAAGESTDARELAIINWNGGEFTLDTAPATDNEIITSFRESMPAGSSGGQELLGDFVKKEVWVQPDGKIRVLNIKPGGGFGSSVL